MKQVLMCSPDYFGVTYDINPWMSDNIGQVDHAKAMEQWLKLKHSISKVADVKVMDGVEGLPDLVFTANAGIVSHDVALISTFYKEQRQPEEIVFRDYFKKHGYITLRINNSYEGEGDHLVDKFDRHWLGTGFRTSKEAAENIHRIFWAKINALELVDPRWYHLDTCFAPLPNGELLWYPDAFSIKSQKLIRESFKHTIDISLEDALAFSCNSVCIDNHIFIPKNIDVSTKLRQHGYNVEEFDLSEFMKAGGAAKCLVLYLNS